MLVSIIVPVYKQEKTIQTDLKRIRDVMLQTRWEFEVIAVVDGMLDKSFENAKKAGNKYIKVFGYENNRGKGYAVKYGMARAKGDYIVFIDAGMEINPNGISMVLEHMEWYDADVIVGSKKHPASKTNLSVIRRIYSWGYSKGVRILFGLKVRDTQAGLKVVKRKVLEKVLSRLLVKAFAFDIELLAVARHLGFKRIYEAPIDINLDFSEGSKLSNTFLFLNPSIRRMMVDTLAVFYRLYILRYYDDDSKRKWLYDKELEMRVLTGEMDND